jgi:hypothetical protein
MISIGFMTSERIRNSRQRSFESWPTRSLPKPIAPLQRVVGNQRGTRKAFFSAIRRAVGSSIRLPCSIVRTPAVTARRIASDAGHDIQKLGGVRRLPFPVPLHMPPVGPVCATRHRDTPVVRNLRGLLRELARKRREAG